MGIAGDIIIIILTGLVFAFVAHRLRLPLILGYIVAGVFLAPFYHGNGESHLHDIELLAEIGVALLLFSIGLDFSLKKIAELKRITLIGTPIQIILSIIFGYFIGQFLNLSFLASLVLGFVISLSSTMIVLKSLMGQGLMGTLSSRIMIGMLIVQDLAAVPMMIIIPKLNQFTESWDFFLLTILKAVVFLVVIIILGTRLIPWFLRVISRLNSGELFLLTIVALSLGIGFASYTFGLSFAFGAFIAGMVINDSEYSHKALSDIMPLRDIFGLLFFTSIGLLFNIGFFLENLETVLSLVALVFLFKFTVFYSLTRIFGYFNIVPLAAGLGLSQIGEFSFVLSRSSLKAGILSQEIYSLVLATTIISLFLSPFIMMLTPKLYSIRKKFYKSDQKKDISCSNLPSEGFKKHIIIAGAGRIGRAVAHTLAFLKYNFVLIEEDFQNFEKAKSEGYPVFFGDATKEIVLEAANLQDAELFVLTIPSVLESREVIQIIKQKRPDLDIVARSSSLESTEELNRMEIFEVVQPEFEASMEMLRQSLLHLDVPVTVIQDYIDQFRQEHYRSRKEPWSERSLLANLKESSHLLELKWERILPGSKADGRSLKKLEIRSRTGLSIAGVYRKNKFFPNPESGFILQKDDMVAVLGKTENRILFKTLMNTMPEHES